MFFITGCESFVGKHLIKECIKKKIKYFGIDINAKNTKFTKRFDLRNKKLDKYIPTRATIIHLAAISKDKLCSKNPELAADVNINGTINLINAAKKKKATKFIFASSIWVYGEKNNIKKDNESTKIDANKIRSIYVLTKILAERYLEIVNLFKSVIILRFGIVYGANNNQNWSIVETIFDLVKKSRNKNNIKIRSKKTSRSFIHIKDLIAGILKASKYNKKFTILNLCGDSLVSVIDIINSAKKIFKINNRILIKQSHASKPSIKSTSNEKAKKTLNWQPRIKLNDYLKKI